MTATITLGGRTLTLGRTRLGLLKPVLGDLERLRLMMPHRIPNEAEVNAMLNIVNASVQSVAGNTMTADDVRKFFEDADVDAGTALAVLAEAFAMTQTIGVPDKLLQASEGTAAGESASP